MVTAALTLLIVTIRYGLSTPVIDPATSEVIIQNGESLNLTCYGSTSVKWEFTNNERKQIQQDNMTVVKIEDATYRDTGSYRCVYNASSSSESASLHLFVKDPSEYWHMLKTRISADEGTDAVLPCLLTDPSIPNSMISLRLVRTHGEAPVTSFNAKTGYTIHNVQLGYNGRYVCLAMVNGAEKKSKEMSLFVRRVPRHPPSVKLEPKQVIRIQREDFQLKCIVSSNTKPSIKWMHTKKNITGHSGNNYIDGTWITDSTIRIPSVDYDDSGDYTCVGENKGGFHTVSTNLQVIERGFVNMSTPHNTSFSLNVGDNLELTVDIEAYPDLLSWKWEHTNPENADNASIIPLQGNLQPSGPYRNRSTLTLSRLKTNESGWYTFYASNSKTSAFLKFQIILYRPPTVKIFTDPFQRSMNVRCTASGIPLPTIQWRRCPNISCTYEQTDALLDSVTEELEGNLVTSVLYLKENIGNSSIYCLASNSLGNESAEMPFTNTVLPVTSQIEHKLFSPLLIALTVVGICLLLISAILFYKYQQKPKYEVRWQIVQASPGNNYTCIDPSQLPYNEKWEFPRTNLQFGKTIGAGAFGKVMEATAFGMGKDDSALRVAVKMLKPSAHSDEVEALMSELKILSHLGHHQNIVNLLGACTYGGPILVITEYCPHGDLLNFLRRKAEAMNSVFSAVLAESTGDYKNMSVEQKYMSDTGFGSKDNSKNIDMKSQQGTLLEDEEEDMDDHLPLDLHDLMNFSLQVAQGMSFLASKNCIHRDVAARNVLVTQGRLAKICDFGLARDIEDDSNYVVKGNARLPVKWMAPESIFDCIYTVQSDVWSYGILLWEIFSLGRSPYSGIIVNRKFYKMIKEGYKMDCPDYAPTEIYRLMKACWDLKPMLRPTFSQISDIISRQMSLIKDQEYANIIQEEEQCMDVKCVDIQEPLIKGNNYQFC